MGVAVVVGWVVAMVVSGGCKIDLGLVVVESAWFQLRDRCWVLVMGMGGIRFAC